MDFLARLDERLREPARPRSALAPYFEAHLLFQGAYHAPSSTPPSSPEPESSVTAVQQHMASSPRPRVSRGKRKHTLDDHGADAVVPRKRMCPNPPTIVSMTPPLTSNNSHTSADSYASANSHASTHSHISLVTSDPDIAAAASPSSLLALQPPSQSSGSRKKRNIASHNHGVAPRAKKHATREPTSIHVGKYALRPTIARLLRTSHQDLIA